MPRIWQITVIAILITGSISSTSGAARAEAGCAGVATGSPADLIAELRRPAGEVVLYDEEIFHPALPTPERTRGSMRIVADGDLLREQLWPEAMNYRIGSDFMTERRGPDGEPNLLPIPREMQPYLQAIRTVVGGDVSTLEKAFSMELIDGGSPRRIRLSPRGEDGALKMDLILCGPRLLGMEINEPGGIRRVLAFGLPE